MTQNSKQQITMRQKFRDVCLELAEIDEKIVLVFGDISVFLFNAFSKRYPDRFINAGICESTLISLSGGLSSQGYYPFVHSINPFLTTRSLEQIKLDMCYNGFGGNIVTCGASFDYAWDGATHHSYSELAELRLLPDIEVMQPGNAFEFETLLKSQYKNGVTSYFRTSDVQHNEIHEVSFGKGIVIKNSNASVTVVTSGPILKNVLLASEDLPVNIVYFHTLKPFDYELLENFRKTKLLVVQDAHGLYEAVCQLSDIHVKCHGLPDKFLTYYGRSEDISAEINLDPEGIREEIKKRLQ
jgi:transketolase